MDSYQAIYDAVRSRISNGDVGGTIADVARQSFDISWAISSLVNDFSIAAEEQARAGREAQRPFMLLRPSLALDGNQWCALYGANLQEGVAGFGDTPEDAAKAFDLAWYSKS